MKKTISLLLAICGLILFLQPAIRAEAIKIGTIDIQRAALESAAGKMAIETLRKKFKRQDTELQRKAAELRKLEDELRNPAMLTLDQRKNKDKEYRRKGRDYRDSLNDFQEELTDAQMEAMAPIQRDIMNLLKKIADEEGFALIIDPKLVGPAMYAPNAIDLTDRVIEDYNKQQSGKK
jgi:outer membrane protein